MDSAISLMVFSKPEFFRGVQTRILHSNPRHRSRRRGSEPPWPIRMSLPRARGQWTVSTRGFPPPCSCGLGKGGQTDEGLGSSRAIPIRYC